MAISAHPSTDAGLTRLSEFEAVWVPRALSVLRIIVSATFLEHAGQGLLNFPPGGQGSPPVGSFNWIGLVIQLVGGVLILLGGFTRWAAFILSGEMAVAYWKFHAPSGFYPAANKGELSVLYCFIFLYLVFAGPGSWSLDSLLSKPKS